ncbi:MAG: hydrogenase maturation protease [Nocardioides sp.]
MRILVACVGNIFLGDDGFGSHVAAALSRRDIADGVRVEDYGIRSVHLTYELMDGYDVLVLVDTVGRQTGPPGTLYVIEPDLAATSPGEGLPEALLDPHDLSPGGAMELAPLLGGSVARILVVGVQPEYLEEGIGLSDAVAAAVEPAADLVVDVVSRELTRLASPAGGGG